MAASTWSTSAAAIKQLAPEGIYDAAFEDGVKFNMTEKDSSLGGLPVRVAINNQGGQGKGGSIMDALSNMQPDALNQFQVQNGNAAAPYEYFTTARIKGSLLRGAKVSGASVADLWDLQMKNSVLAAKEMFAIYQYGDGSGTLGTISAGSNVATATITLAVIQDAVNFGIGQSVQLVSSGTIVSAGAKAVITAIDRDLGTLTFAAALTSYIAGAATGQQIVNAGDLNVPAPGDPSWVGSSATLYGLTRTADPVKFGGHLYNATTLNPGEALMNLSALIETYGKQGKLFICNNKALMNWKKLLEGKTQYQRVGVQSKTAGIGYGAMEFEGTNGAVKVLGDRFCPYTTAYMVNETDGPQYASFGDLVQVLDFDSLEFQRDPTDDSYTVRNGSYYVYYYNGNLVSQGRLSNFMA